MSCVSRRSLLSAAALLATGALAACSGSGDAGSSEGGSTLRVGASPSPHAEILSDFAAPRLAERGITLEVREYTDYLLPNQDVTTGELDANYFQHINYLNNYNEENGTDLVSAGKVHFEPMGVFAGRSSDLAGVPEGATVLIKTTDDDPIEGFMSAEAIEAYKGTIQAFDYQADGYNVTLFANTLTNKAHQQDEYRYLSAALYSKLLEGDFEA